MAGRFIKTAVSAAAVILIIFRIILPAASYAGDAGPSGTLPVIYIDTDGGAEVRSKTDYIRGSMKIELTGETSGLSSLYTESEAGISIRARGNSTYWQDKKPYKIKLDTSDSLLWMGKSRHWILLANVYDRTFLRNELSYAFSGELGLNRIKAAHAELVLNGEYMGLYQLTESVRIEDGRIGIKNWKKLIKAIAADIAGKSGADAGDIAEMLENDLSWYDTGYFKDGGGNIADVSRYADEIDVSGGYLFELDEYYDKKSKFMTAHDVPIMIDTPENAFTSMRMTEFCEDYFRHMESALASPDFHDRETGKHYSEFIDIDSFVDYWIVNQAFKSVELLFKSCFMYLDDGGKLIFGPVWDMDWSSGNHVNLNDSSAAYDQWLHGESQDREYWYRVIYDDPWFVEKLKKRWSETRDIFRKYIDSIDERRDALADAVRCDRERWGEHSMSFADECAALKEWMTSRAGWMDEQLSKRDPNIMRKGIENDRLLTLALTDSVGSELDPYPDGGDLAADYIVASDDISLKIDVKHDFVKKWVILVNGAIFDTVAAEGRSMTVGVPGAAAVTDDGTPGIIMVLGENDGGSVYDAGYVSIRPSEDFRLFVTKAGADDPAGTDGDDVKTFSVCAAAAAAVFVSCAAAALVIIKKRKRNIDTDTES